MNPEPSTGKPAKKFDPTQDVPRTFEYREGMPFDAGPALKGNRTSRYREGVPFDAESILSGKLDASLIPTWRFGWSNPDPEMNRPRTQFIYWGFENTDWHFVIQPVMNYLEPVHVILRPHPSQEGFILGTFDNLQKAQDWCLSMCSSLVKLMEGVSEVWKGRENVFPLLKNSVEYATLLQKEMIQRLREKSSEEEPASEDPNTDSLDNPTSECPCD